jgi:hypothetical protein
LDVQSDVLLFAAPQQDISERAAEQIGSFLEQGGAAAFYMENSAIGQDGAGLRLNKDDLPFFYSLFEAGAWN